MTGANLKAVDRVVKIVREFDRYNGFAAAERRLPEASDREAPVEGAAVFGAALFRRPEIALQDAEMIEFAPGILFASEAASAAEQDLVLELPRGNAIARSPQGDVAIQGSVERPTASGSPASLAMTVEALHRPARPWGITSARRIRRNALKRLISRARDCAGSAILDRGIRLEHASRRDALRRSPA